MKLRWRLVSLYRVHTPFPNTSAMAQNWSSLRENEAKTSAGRNSYRTCPGRRRGCPEHPAGRTRTVANCSRYHSDWADPGVCRAYRHGAGIVGVNSAKAAGALQERPPSRGQTLKRPRNDHQRIRCLILRASILVVQPPEWSGGAGRERGGLHHRWRHKPLRPG